MLYYNPELYSYEVTVKEVKGNEACFDKTIFYPGGGGQPCDTGTVTILEHPKSAHPKRINVLGAYEKDGKVWHKLSSGLDPGTKVLMELDRQKRESLVRMHTAEHILFRCLQNQIKEISLVKIRLDTNESVIYARADSINWNTLIEAEKQANKVIKEDLDIKEYFVNKSEVEKYPKLRISSRIQEEKIRVVEVHDFDWSACRGIHAKSSGKVNNILITGLNKTDNYEIRFQTDCFSKILYYSGEARIAASIMETDVGSVNQRIKALKKNYHELKEKIRDMSRKAANNVRVEEVDGNKIVWQEFYSAEKKQLIEQGRKLAKGKSIVVFFNKEKEKRTIMIMTSENSCISAEQIMEKLRKKGAQGGGRGNFASGLFNGSIEDIKGVL